MKPRNHHAYHPIMKKGGVHEKSNKAKRNKSKRETQKAAAQWRGRSHSVSAIQYLTA